MAAPQGRRPEVAIQEGVPRLAGRARLAGPGVDDTVGDGQTQTRIRFYRRDYRDAFPVTDARLIFAGDSEHRDDDAAFLHLVVAEAGALKEVGSGFLEPADVVRMMDHAHLVGFIILDLMEVWGSFFHGEKYAHEEETGQAGR